MINLLIILFVLGYLLIAIESIIKINKAAIALALGVSCWLIYILFVQDFYQFADLPAAFLDRFTEEKIAMSEPLALLTQFAADYQLLNHFGEIANILFFLLGAMTIVEIIDTYDGFAIITDRIHAVKKVKLLWIISLLTFFLSAVLDNLTTTIVMVTLLDKLIADQKDRLFMAGIIVIAANAGGAWTPIGDVTTTMLWIGGQITAANIMKVLFIPSLICLVLPLTYLTLFKMKGNVERPEVHQRSKTSTHSVKAQRTMLIMGVCGLILVPILKAAAHLQPFMGMMFSLSILWMTAEIISRKSKGQEYASTHIIKALQRVDTSSILFFLGILMAVAALQSTGILISLANHLENWIGNESLIVMAIGLLSSIVDNVPLVAAGMGMYDYPTDHFFWEFLAYCAGTGGSCLIIGSAAGIAAMGLERIDFIWYMKNLSLLALLGYFGGAGAYILIERILMG